MTYFIIGCLLGSLTTLFIIRWAIAPEPEHYNH